VGVWLEAESVVFSRLDRDTTHRAARATSTASQNNGATPDETTSDRSPWTIIDSITSRDPGFRTFLSEEIAFPFPLLRVREAVAAALKASDEHDIAVDTTRSVITTSVTRHGFIGFPTYLRHAVSLRATGSDSTLMLFRVLVYSMNHDQGGGMAVVTNPDAVAQRRRQFVDRVRSALGAHASSRALGPLIDN